MLVHNKVLTVKTLNGGKSRVTTPHIGTRTFSPFGGNGFGSRFVLALKGSYQPVVIYVKGELNGVTLKIHRIIGDCTCKLIKSFTSLEESFINFC